MDDVIDVICSGSRKLERADITVIPRRRPARHLVRRRASPGKKVKVFNYNLIYEKDGQL